MSAGSPAATGMPALAGVLPAAALLAVWPFPGTIALRYLLLAAAGAVALRQLSRERGALRPAAAPAPWLIAALLAWAVAHALALSHAPGESVGELGGEWVRAGLGALAGVGAALAVRGKPGLARVLAAAFVLPLAVFVAWALLHAAGLVGPGRYEWGPFDHKLSVGFGAGLAGTAACAALAHFAGHGASLRHWGAAAGVLALSVLAAVLADSRNGLIVLALAVCALGAHAVLGAPRLSRRGRIALGWALALALAVAAGGTLQRNPHWHSLAADFEVAWDVDGHTHWRNGQGPLPANRDGATVSHSNYMRVAWAHVGLRLAAEHPLGYGPLETSFKRLVEERWPGSSVSHTHSGWLDLWLALGIPGVALVALAMASAWRRAARAQGLPARIAQWAVPALALFWLLDAVARDHYLELSLFLLAYFGVATATPAGEPR